MEARDAGKHSVMHRTVPFAPAKNEPAQMSIVLRLRNPALESSYHHDLVPMMPSLRNSPFQISVYWERKLDWPILSTHPPSDLSATARKTELPNMGKLTLGTLFSCWGCPQKKNDFLWAMSLKNNGARDQTDITSLGKPFLFHLLFGLPFFLAHVCFH